MRVILAALGVMTLAGPVAAQPFIVPLQQRPAEAPPSPPSPAPVAPPQSGGPSQADAQPGNTANPPQASGDAQDGNAPRAPEQ